MTTITSSFSGAVSAFTRVCRKLIRRTPMQISRVQVEQEMMRMTERDKLMAEYAAGLRL